jgi:hypothetical protein
MIWRIRPGDWREPPCLVAYQPGMREWILVMSVFAACDSGTGGGGSTTGGGGSTTGGGGGSTTGGGGGSTTGGGGGSTTGGGGGSTTGGGGGSTTGTGGGSALTIVSLTISPAQLVDNSSVTISAIVTDTAGLSAIAGGTLTDPNGISYGAFSTAGGQGTFSLSLTWTDVQNISPIQTPPGGGVRALVATFYDNNANSAQKPLSLPLACHASQYAVCDGKCANLDFDKNNCGACGVSVPECYNGVAGCSSGYTLCNNQCVNLSTNPDYCGSCDNSCTPWAIANHVYGQILSCEQGVCCANGVCGSAVGGGSLTPCQSCVRTGPCKTQYDACQADAACAQLYTCVASCSTPTCATNCYTAASATGQTKYDAWDQCTCTSCTAQCGAC